MKFATRISSIRRQAWKQCRSCSADSDSMCADSLARQRARGVDPLALGLEHARDRVLREPVDLEVGVQRAQLLGDRDVAARVAEPDRRGDEQRAAAPRAAAASTPRGRGGRDEVAQQQVDLHRVARLRAVAGALERHQLAAGRLAPARRPGRAGGSGPGRRGSRAPGTRTRAAMSREAPRGPHRSSAGVVSASVSGSVSSAQPTQSSICLVECGSLNIWREEELEEAEVVLAASSGGCTSPSPRRCRAPPRSGRRSPARVAGRERDGRADVDDRRQHALGVVGGQQRRPQRAARQAARAPRARCPSRPSRPARRRRTRASA